MSTRPNCTEEDPAGGALEITLEPEVRAEMERLAGFEAQSLPDFVGVVCWRYVFGNRPRLPPMFSVVDGGVTDETREDLDDENA